MARLNVSRVFLTLKVVGFLFSRQPIDNLTPEERDARTVFCMQLAARIRARDLEDFFSAVGKVSQFTVISSYCYV